MVVYYNQESLYLLVKRQLCCPTFPTAGLQKAEIKINTVCNILSGHEVVENPTVCALKAFCLFVS